LEQGNGIRIQPAVSERREAVRAFVLGMMRDLYPPGSYYENPYDLAFFEDVYLQPANAGFFIAENDAGEIVGTAAVKPYDRRFGEVEPTLGGGPICEIAKVYLRPECRRLGIGSRLYACVEQLAREAGYAEGYLHTSLYLPGGYPFWLSRGYEVRYRESEQIAHLSKRWTQPDS
jgi:GNAT superfamily N-acetyltransferase